MRGSLVLLAALLVTLNASNSTGRTLRVPYLSPTTYAQFTQGAQTLGNPQGGFTGLGLSLDTLVMTSGNVTTVGKVVVDFRTPPEIGPNLQIVTLAAGTYTVKACIVVPPPPSDGALCGKGMSFTLTP